MKKSRSTDSQMITALEQAEAGTPVPEACREHGMFSATFYRRRSKFGGKDASPMPRLKELGDQNRHLKTMHAESQMTVDVLREALSKRW